MLDAGSVRVAEKRDGVWTVNQWLKKAVLLSFRIAPNAPVEAQALKFYDKVPLKFSRLERGAVRGVRRARGAARDGAPRRIRRAERRA